MRRSISWGLGITTIAAAVAGLSAWATMIYPARYVASACAIAFGLAGLSFIVTTYPYWRERSKLDIRLAKLKDEPSAK